MTIRLKILALSTALLALLCAALFVSVRLQENIHEEIAGITEYHIPITGLVTRIDLQTFEYELLLGRLLRHPEPRLTEAVEREERQLIATINGAFDKAEELIARAIEDSRNDLADRLVFARLLGTFSMLRRDLEPFEQLGLDVLEQARRGEWDEARALLTGFQRFETSFGPDLARVRGELEKLTASSTEETLGQQGSVERLSLGVFLGAAVLGLGFAGLMAGRMAGGLRRLVAGARAVEQGTLTEPLPILSRDEVGQLTRAFNSMAAELRARERIKDTFGKYVDPKIVAGLIDATAENLDKAERRVVTVFFSDIKGFSGLSEQLTATAIANLLNRYFATATEAIRAHNGVLDKYIGDSVMAFWTPPFSAGDDHARDACLAALAQQQAIQALRRELPNILGLRRQVPDFVVRMGIATGEVVVGTIGSPTAKSYTVIGDTVNLASRLEGINKVYGTGILVSEDTWRLAQGAVEGREIDLVTVAGKTEPVRIFEVMGSAEAAGGDGERLCARYAEALARYRARDWEGARAGFAACLELAAGDPPSRVLLERIDRFVADPPPPDWDGVWRMAEK